MGCRRRRSRILDQFLPSLTPPAQVRELRRLLYDLEELREVYHEIAVTENDPEAANVAVRTAHEIAQLRQFVGGSAHNDPIQLQKVADPKQRGGPARLLEALERLCKEGHASPQTQENVAKLRSSYAPKHDDPEGWESSEGGAA
jgi:hypothetical protein